MYSVLFGINTMTGDATTSCAPLLDVKEIVVFGNKQWTENTCKLILC